MVIDSLRTHMGLLDGVKQTIPLTGGALVQSLVLIGQILNGRILKRQSS